MSPRRLGWTLTNGLHQQLNGLVRRTVTDDGDIQTAARVKPKRAFDGAGGVEDRGALRRFISRVQYQAREGFLQFGGQVGIGDRQGRTIDLRDRVLAAFERDLDIPLDADPQQGS